MNPSSHSNATFIPVSSWLLLASMSLLIFLLCIDFTVVNLAMPQIADNIESELNDLQWLLSVYSLAWGALVIPGGRLGDVLGTKRVLLSGVILFVVGSILTGAGHTLAVLIMGRIIQGLGGALFSPAIYALTMSIFPQERHGTAVATFGAASALGLSVGPTLGGLVLQHLSWRWIFYINLPLGLAAIAALAWLAPKDGPRQSLKNISLLNVILLSGALILIMTTLNHLEIWGVGDPRFWGGMAASLVMLAAFYVLDARQLVPILPRSLFKQHAYLFYMFANAAVSYFFCLVMVMGNLYFQNTLMLPIQVVGYAFLCLTGAQGIVSFISGRWIDRVGPLSPTLTGLILSLMCSAGFLFFDASVSLTVVLSVLVVGGLGLGLTFTAVNAGMLRSLPAEIINTGSGFFTMATLIANTLGIVLSTSIATYAAQKWLLGVPDLSNSVRDSLVKVTASAHVHLDSLREILGISYDTGVAALHQAQTRGLHAAVLFGLGVIVVCIVFGQRGLRQLLKVSC